MILPLKNFMDDEKKILKTQQMILKNFVILGQEGSDHLKRQDLRI